MSRVLFCSGALLALTTMIACGGKSVPNAKAAAGQSDVGTSAYIVNKAVDPRSNDPTAQKPPPAKLDAPPPTDPTMIGTSTPSAKSPPAEPPKQIGARHVLIQWMGSQKAGPSVLRSREQALAVAEDVLKKAKAGADMGRLAVDYSDEPSASLRAGSLGRFGHGAMVPAFEKVAFSLAVGEISEIVETPFGFHVIQRTE